jgi:hypothetical protein
MDWTPEYADSKQAKSNGSPSDYYRYKSTAVPYLQKGNYKTSILLVTQRKYPFMIYC